MDKSKHEWSFLGIRLRLLINGLALRGAKPVSAQHFSSNWFSVKFWRALGGLRPRVRSWHTPCLRCSSDVPVPAVPWPVSPFAQFMERPVPAPLSLLSPHSIGISGPYRMEHLKRQIRACEGTVDRQEHLVPAEELSLAWHNWFEAQDEERCPKGCISRQEEMWALLTYRDLSSAPFFNDNCSSR